MRETTQLRQCYRLTFEDEAGSAVLADLEARAFVNTTSFSTDPQQTAFNEGRRSLALHIRRMLAGSSAQRVQENPQQG